MMCANPRELPANSKNRLCKPPRTPRTNPRELPAISGAQTPSLPKGREYSVPPSGVRHTPFVVSAEIEALAHRVRRLSVSHRDPERFHIDKSEIAHALHCLARCLDHQPQKG